MVDIGKQKVKIPCPNCDRKIEVSLDQVSMQQAVICSCGTKIELKDKNGSAKKGIHDINKAFSDLKKTLKKIGK